MENQVEVSKCCEYESTFTMYHVATSSWYSRTELMQLAKPTCNSFISSPHVVVYRVLVVLLCYIASYFSES